MRFLVQSIVDPNLNFKSIENIAKHLDVEIQLRFLDKNRFDNCYENLRDALGYDAKKVTSICGPSYPISNSTLFEDTVAIVSKLEDNLEVDIRSITTPFGSKHIDELCDFYRDEVSINVLPYSHSGKLGRLDPITMAIKVDGMRSIIPQTEIGMTIEATKVSKSFFDESIIVPLSDYIGEIHIDFLVGVQTHMPPDPNFLSKLKSNASLVLSFNPNDTLDISYFNRIKQIVALIKQKLAILEHLGSPSL